MSDSHNHLRRVTGPREPTDLDRLVAMEHLRTLKARFCRFTATKAWDDLDRIFTSNGQVRVYSDDGDLLFFADAPDIGGALAERYDDRVVILQAFLEELTVSSRTRAEGIWAIESLAVPSENSRTVGAATTGSRAHGYGYLYETYEVHEGQWLIRSLEFTRQFLERT